MTVNPIFFAVSGAILILSGGLQVLVRPRTDREKGLQRVINRATIRATVFVLVGLTGVLVGLGYIPLSRLGL